MELQAKQLFNDLQATQAKLVSFAAAVQQHGEKGGKGFASGVSSGVGGAFAGLKSALGGVLGGLGVGLGVGVIVSKFEQVIEKGSRIHDIAGKFHVDAEQLQLIGNAAEQDGVSLEKVAGAMNRLQIAGATAAKAGSPINKAVKELQIDAENFAAANPAEKFFLVGEAYQKAGFSAESYAAAAALVGKKNTDVLLTMEQSRTAIEKVSREFGILSTEQTNALDRAGDAIKSFNNKVTIGFGEAITKASHFSDTMKAAGDAYATFLVNQGLAPKGFAQALGFEPSSDLTSGGGKFGGVGAGSSFGDEATTAAAKAAEATAAETAPSGPAVNPFDIYAASLKGGVSPEDALLASQYAQSQGLSDTTGINLGQAAEFQRQALAAEAQNALTDAAQEGPLESVGAENENIRAGELENQFQQDLSEQALEIATWEAGEQLLGQIRDAITDGGGNI